jgi:GTPase SAR1 family protein
MTSEELNKLIQRIQNETSVLFLGQDYLRGNGQDNPFLINAGNKCAVPKVSSWSELWNSLVKKSNGTVARQDEELLIQAVQGIPKQEWLGNIVRMPWTTIFTSAVDNTMVKRVGTLSYNPIFSMPLPKEIRSKSCRNVVCLFGAVDRQEEWSSAAQIPRDKGNLFSRKQSAREMLNVIGRNLIPFRGLLVIDGWNPSSDWAKPEHLLRMQAESVQDKSIYIFSASEEVQNAVNEDEYGQFLVENGKVVFESCSLYQAITENEEEINSEIFKTEDMPIQADFVNKHYIYITVGNTEPIEIPMAEIAQIPENISVFDDRLFEGKGAEYAPQVNASNFAKFLCTDKLKERISYIEHQKFYCSRTKDKEIMTFTEDELKKSSIQRKMILICGPSNSGKTTFLTNYAIRMYKRGYPVIFISGSIDENTGINTIEALLSNHFKKHNPIVIWDNNIDLDAVKMYRWFYKMLRMYNIVMIGTSYFGESAQLLLDSQVKTESRVSKRELSSHLIELSDQLDSTENPKFSKLIASLGSNYESKIKSIIESKFSTQYGFHIPLFVILLRIFGHDYEQEFIDLRKRLAGNSSSNIHVTNTIAEQFIEDYTTRIQKGAESALQVALAQMNTGVDSESSALQGAIESINVALAVAGQFSVALPLNLVLRLFTSSERNLYQYHLDRFCPAIYSALKLDSILRQFSHEGEEFIQFRYAVEAEWFLSEKYPDKKERLKKEINNLECIIELANLSDYSPLTRTDSEKVLQLVRAFGTNSKGKPSEHHDQKTDYTVYGEYFEKISDFLITHAQTSGGDISNPEVALVAAHFLRESFYSVDLFSADCEIRERSWDKLDNARECLLEAKRLLEQEEQSKTSQYARILVELSTNFVWRLPENQPFTPEQNEIYGAVCSYISAAFNICNRKKMSSLSQMTLLDIRLNAFHKYKSGVPEAVQQGTDTDLAAVESFRNQLDNAENAIYDMLDMEEITNATTLNHIIEVYQVSKALGKVEKLSENLMQRGNDVGIYHHARQFWRNNNLPLNSVTQYTDISNYDLYFTSDFCTVNDRNASDELKQIAGKTAQFLTDTKKHPNVLCIVEKSPRCLEMLIRSLWIWWAGKMPYTEKQTPSLTNGQWEQLYRYSSKYALLQAEHANSFPYFIKGVYEYMFVETSHSATMEEGNYYRTFEYLIYENSLRRPSDWNITFLYLCREKIGDEKIGNPIPFYADITTEQSESGYQGNVRSFAQLMSCPDSNLDDRLKVLYRKGIRVPPFIFAQYLGIFTPRSAVVEDHYLYLGFSLGGAKLLPPPEVEEA